MKEDINHDEILDHIVVKKAPDDLINRWKAEVELLSKRRIFLSALSKPSVIIALAFACVWYYILIIKPYLYDFNFFSKIFSSFIYILQIPGNMLAALMSGHYYIIVMNTVSFLIAAVALFWFYIRRRYIF